MTHGITCTWWAANDGQPPPGWGASPHPERKTGRLKVGIVMIKCPQTGRAIPTGIKADRESFRRSAVFFARTHCSICQTNHDWFAKEAWVYEPSVDKGVWPP